MPKTKKKTTTKPKVLTLEERVNRQAEALLSDTLRKLRAGEIVALECGDWSAGFTGKFTLKVTYTVKK